MLSIQNFNKVGNYVLTIFVAISLCACGFFIGRYFPPLSSESGDINGTTIESIRTELEEAVKLNADYVGELHNLGQQLEERNKYIEQLETTSYEGYGNNLQYGDLIIEAGITADDSLLIIQELRRRLN